GVSGSHWATPFKKLTTPQISPETFNDATIQSNFSRIKLVNSYANSRVVDAKFSGNTVDRFVASSLRKDDITSSAVHTSEMMEYRYLLCPAGNDVSSALYWIIRTNSIAFKEETAYETVPDYFLKPWVHYIPISPGLHDIEEKFEFCENNQDYCKQVIENAQSAYSAITTTNTWVESESIVLDRLGLL